MLSDVTVRQSVAVRGGEGWAGGARPTEAGDASLPGAGCWRPPRLMRALCAVVAAAAGVGLASPSALTAGQSFYVGGCLVEVLGCALAARPTPSCSRASSCRCRHLSTTHPLGRAPFAARRLR